MAEEFQVFIGPKLKHTNDMAAGHFGPTFPTEEEAAAYCKNGNATDPENQYGYKKVDI